MSLKREIEAEKELNSYLYYRDKFDFNRFCNSFQFQNNSIFRIILKTGDILSTRMMFLENLYTFNTYVLENKLGVLAVIYMSDNSNDVIIEANFSICDDENEVENDEAITAAFDFLSYISEYVSFDFEKFQITDVKKYIYEKSLSEYCMVCNISNLLKHNKNKRFYEISFHGIDIEHLKLQLDFQLRQYNLAHPDKILYMQGVLNKTDSGVILKAYISQDTDDPKGLSGAIFDMLSGLEPFRGRYTHNEVDEAETLIYGEFLNGGVFVGNIEEPIGLP